ncbi:hypothetical protein [Streptomyces pratensis]|uniref:hypothetical protein n=1 Tax=Streptomyces pratensis TaxID=1169025 RepID=UPI001932218F|nr:hypothetical protein [Streptomyces pratensis]
MKNHGKKYWAVTLASSVLAGGLWLAGPTFASGPADSSRTTAAPAAHDARAVFRGVFFGHGPAAADFARHHGMTPAATPADTALENTLMDRLEARDPGIVDRLHAAAVSGSYVRTRHELREAARALASLRGAGATDTAVTQEVTPKALVVWLALWVVKFVWLPVTASDGGVTTDGLTHDVVTAVSG